MAQNLLDTDSFGGTNGNALHTYNANWLILDTTGCTEAAIAGSPGVGSGSGPTVGSELRTGFTWTNDQWGELTIDATTLADSRMLVLARATQGTANNCTGYAAGVHRDLTGGTYQIYKFSASNTFTVLGTATGHSYAVGDVINFQVVGTTLTLTVNGSVILNVTDATYSTGSPGLIVGAQAGRLGGTWRAGSVGSSGTTFNVNLSAYN